AGVDALEQQRADGRHGGLRAVTDRQQLQVGAAQRDDPVVRALSLVAAARLDGQAEFALHPRLCGIQVPDAVDDVVQAEAQRAHCGTVCRFAGDLGATRVIFSEVRIRT